MSYCFISNWFLSRRPPSLLRVSSSWCADVVSLTIHITREANLVFKTIYLMFASSSFSFCVCKDEFDAGSFSATQSSYLLHAKASTTCTIGSAGRYCAGKERDSV